jgi:hypothetical protein
VSRIQQLESQVPYDTITYIAQARQANLAWGLLFGNYDADYALFSLSSATLRNNYYITKEDGTGSKQSNALRCVEEYLDDGSLEIGTVEILFGVGEVITTELLQVVEISICGLKFKTRKLVLPQVLG